MHCSAVQNTGSLTPVAPAPLPSPHPTTSPPAQGLDIGPKSIDLLKGTLKGAKTVIWNGPMGVFEFDAFAKGELQLLLDKPASQPASHMCSAVGASLGRGVDWAPTCRRL